MTLPAPPARRRRSSISERSEVTTSACLTAVTMATTASMTLEVRAAARSAPASWAPCSVIGTTSQPRKRRRSGICEGERLTWPTTGAGTTGTTPPSSRARWSAQKRRSFRSAAISAPASYTAALGQRASANPADPFPGSLKLRLRERSVLRFPFGHCG